MSESARSEEEELVVVEVVVVMVVVQEEVEDSGISIISSNITHQSPDPHTPRHLSGLLDSRVLTIATPCTQSAIPL